jgi:hypothetical protein
LRVVAEEVPPDEVDAFVRATTRASATGLALSLLSVAVLPGWRGATLGVAQGLAWCALLLAGGSRPWAARVVTFGSVAGVVELLADVWLVHGTGTLVYPPGGPFLLASPAYMPAAWLGMLTGGVALGVVLRRRLGRAASAAAVAAAMGAYVPFYEALARAAGWWWYQGVPLHLGAVPAYIVLGEVLIGIPLVAAAERLTRVGTRGAVLLGVAQGLWIFASYALAWVLLS